MNSNQKKEHKEFLKFEFQKEKNALIIHKLKSPYENETLKSQYNLIDYSFDLSSKLEKKFPQNSEPLLHMFSNDITYKLHANKRLFFVKSKVEDVFMQFNHIKVD